MKALSLVIFFVLFPLIAWGQNNSTPAEVSLTSGPLLPNLVPGMDEIMPVGGIRYKFGGLPLEFGYMNANSDDVSYNNLFVSLRGEMPAGGFMTFYYVGLDNHYYKPFQETEYVNYSGGHIGGGMMAFIGDRVWFRTEMKFNMNPGTSLYIGFGFNIVLSE